MNDTAKLALRLMMFALVAALLLAFVNGFTKDKIAENTLNKVNEARRAVIGDYEFEDTGVELTDCQYIKGVYAAKDGESAIGYVYELESKGYGGTIYLSVGIAVDGTLTGVKVSSHKETKGLGTDAQKEFLDSFVGLSVDKDAMSVDAMSGATISSNAVRNPVNEAMAHYSENFKEE